MNNFSVQDKIKIYQEYFDQKLKYNSNQAVVTYFVYQEIDNNLKSILRLLFTIILNLTPRHQFIYLLTIVISKTTIILIELFLSIIPILIIKQ